MVAGTKPARLGSRPAMASACWRSAVQIGSTDETFSRGVAMTILYGELLPRKSVEFQNAPRALPAAPFFLKFHRLALKMGIPSSFPKPPKGTPKRHLCPLIKILAR